MSLLAADNISKRFDDQVIVESVSFTIVAGARIGLVGRNGSGKTTLFDLLAGRQSVDDGTITRSRGLRIDYVEQEKDEFREFTLFDYVASARDDLLDLRHLIAGLEQRLAEDPSDRRSLDRLGQAQQEYETRGGFGFESEVKLILTGLGFPECRFRDRLAEFSGGEKNRAGLARLLAGNGQLLLLDEPTNHLDIDSTKWLEEYLNGATRSFIVVSHDRAFLSATVNQVWEIYRGRIDVYQGRFGAYLDQRSERRRLAEHYYRHQQEEIRRAEDFIQRNMAGQKTRQAKSRLKALAKIKRLPPPESDGRGPAIAVTSSGRSFAHVLNVDSLSVGYDGRSVVDDVNFDIYRGDKVGLIGANGSGKSTLLKTLIGELEPIYGDIRLGNNVDVAYFDQELSDLVEDMTVLETIWQCDPIVESGAIRSFLARFGFVGEDVLKPVRALSGGEKTKLSLARLLYHPANFIIFDEPTNHLDLMSREALEDALGGYDGSLLVVSHDRYFLDRVVNRIVAVADGTARTFDGNYSEYAEKAARPEAPRKNRGSDDSRESYRDFKERSKQRARLKKEISATRERIGELERELATLAKELETEVTHYDWQKLQALNERKDTVETEILHLYVELEKLEGQQDD